MVNSDVKVHQNRINNSLENCSRGHMINALNQYPRTQHVFVVFLFFYSFSSSLFSSPFFVSFSGCKNMFLILMNNYALCFVLFCDGKNLSRRKISSPKSTVCVMFVSFLVAAVADAGLWFVAVAVVGGRTC